MGTPDDIIAGASLYMKIYFAGMPIIMVYNFGSAILRAVGDTRRPLYYLCIAGVINVALNILFVKYFTKNDGYWNGTYQICTNKRHNRH
jgi:Na+-driven multidrug efflux pump